MKREHPPGQKPQRFWNDSQACQSTMIVLQGKSEQHASQVAEDVSRRWKCEKKKLKENFTNTNTEFLCDSAVD